MCLGIAAGTLQVLDIAVITNEVGDASLLSSYRGNYQAMKRALT